ncbi:DUF1345 domain-containing protein [Kutzneria viridogrisea]|uniref:Membrane protein n=1 Tax=Kutzneria viridogrisea TaxID=47990 RepID=A0ABR6BKP4_9PSEU|nr:putative membrane protein [Kutzneria viridogrisea]
MNDEALPAWRQRTATEHRWPVALAILLALGLQLPLPDKLNFLPSWLLPGLTTLLVVLVVAVNPGRVGRYERLERSIGLVVAALVSFGNAVNGVQLVRHILDGSLGDQAGPLLSNGASVYVTNIIVFSLWYWEFDRGGPAVRASGVREYPDFLFPQMSSPELAPRDWEPRYLDYLYLSFTNATAFSPTDVMPLRTWAKLAMLAQSVISLLIVVLVVARAVNVLH